ncbi:sulfatase-like hydrolase/transferase [Sulfitobacter sp. SK012]|uniref:sulfatase-like hydrolase/transferase n=1 Tax=Sulfitobacter sp. SK012 TaxID=1389005 RepID=UPI0020C82A33|nr:sulfatase-like hydrolase/transferase [Sulfitobacter sp. SK012]
MTKPTKNVLFVMADEHQAAALSCLRHPVVQTPNLDRLAARGTLFANAYTPSPICVPARAAVATGLYPHQTRYWDNAHAYDGRVASWSHALGAHGVSTISIGKLHYRRAEDPTGFDTQILPMHIQGSVGQIWRSVRNPLPKTETGGGMLGQVGAAARRLSFTKAAEHSPRWMRFGTWLPMSGLRILVCPLNSLMGCVRRMCGSKKALSYPHCV